MRFTPGQECESRCCEVNCEEVEAEFDFGDGSRLWPSIFHVYSQSCPDTTGHPYWPQPPLGPTNGTCTTCDIYRLSLAEEYRYPLYAVGSEPIVKWQTRAWTECLSPAKPLWTLIPDATGWSLYAGDETDHIAHYRSTVHPHRYWKHPWANGECLDTVWVGQLCGDFELQTGDTTDDCEDWPDKVQVFGCNCAEPEEQHVCVICNDCNWDNSLIDECCVPRAVLKSITNYEGGTPPYWDSYPGCGTVCVAEDGDTDYVPFVGNDMFNEWWEGPDNTYPACLFQAVCYGSATMGGLGFRYALFFRIWLYYDKSTDRYRVFAEMFYWNLEGPGWNIADILGWWISDWFDRGGVTCYDWGDIELNAMYSEMCCLGSEEDPIYDIYGNLCAYYGDLSVMTIEFENWIPCTSWTPFE